jgi:3'-phosphoadenosine 5'-phosphosulfate sulfotransferase (PAPS reductase)/FAD synthetase
MWGNAGMLITTARHTKEDLSLCEDYKLLDSKTYWSVPKKERSMNIIKYWCKLYDDPVLMTSWGKDSVVLMHLLVESGLNIPVVYFKNEHANPDCDLVKEEFLRQFDINYNEVFITYEELSNHKKEWHWQFISDKYGSHRITGIRNDESNTRKMIYRIYGHNSKNSCRPLSLWKLPEIFGYIEQNNLPLCPVYGYLGGGRWERDNIRTHSLGGEAGNNYGKAEWEKEYYKDEMKRYGKY